MKTIFFLLISICSFGQMQMPNVAAMATNTPRVNGLYTAFAARVAAAGTPIIQPYDLLTNQLLNALRFKMGRNETTSLFSSLDILRVEAGPSKEFALQNMINSSYTGIINNDYAGSFDQNIGLEGNGVDFWVNTVFQPSGGSQVYDRNSASMGVLILEDKSGDNNHDFSGLKAGGSDGVFLRAKRSSASGYWTDGDINNSIQTTPFTTVLSARGWYQIERTESTTQRTYLNGWRGVATPATSALEFTGNVVEFAANVNGTISSYVSSHHAVFYAGTGNVESNSLMEIVNKYFIYPLGNATSAIKNRVHFVGDSMTGDETLANQAISVISEYPRRTLSNLGTTWMGSQNGNANREVVASTVVPSLESILTGEILGYSAGTQSTFKNSALDKDILVFYIGTNDLAFHAVTDANTLMTGISNVYTAVKALGYKTIWIGAPDREAGFSGGQTSANFATANADFRSDMLATYTTATAVTDVWMNADGNLFIDIRNDSRFDDATDLTYYNADQVHLNTLGYDELADDLVTPAIQLF